VIFQRSLLSHSAPPSLLLAFTLVSTSTISACGSGHPSADPPRDSGTEPDASVPVDPEPDASVPVDPEPDASVPVDPEPDASVPVDPEPDAGTGGDEVFAYAGAVFATTHNSYMGGARGSIPAQLDSGIRGIELDVHDDSFETEGFRVGHDEPGDEVQLGGGNPATPRLADWLATIATWSDAHPWHAPITLVIDLKDRLASKRYYENGNFAYLNQMLVDAFGERLHRADFAPAPPPELPAGSVVAVLSGDRESRLAYVRDRGRDPAVAIDSNGRVVTVHGSQDGNGNLWYWTGQLDGEGGVRFHRHAGYDTGMDPAVVLRDDGIVIEVHNAPDDARLFYRVGVLRDDFEIEWFEEGGVAFPSNDTGRYPTVRFSSAAGIDVREIHQSQNNSQHWYWDGALDPTTHRITWSRGADGGRTDDPLFEEARDQNGATVVEVTTGASGPHGSDTLLFRIGAGEQMRIRYDQVFFVEAQHGDGASLEQDALTFFAASAESADDRAWAQDRRLEGHMVRLWALDAESYLTPVDVSYPATDVPDASWYRAHCAAIPCLE
jgi:hypothetical protein